MKLSVITPSFRQLSYLKLCIRSVVDQGVDVEHIIQDAGTGPDLEKWIHEHSSARLYVEKDEGMYDAINRGLRRAEGEVLAYLNCDEQYLPDTLQKVARFFSDHPDIDVLFGDALLVDENGSPLSYRRTVLPVRSHVRWVHLNTLTCSTFFRRRILEQGHWFDSRWRAIGDAVWVDGMLAAGIRMAVLPEPLAVFTFTGANLGASDRAARELREWQAGAWQVKFAPFISLVHRIRKWRAGAYRKHVVNYAIYTLCSPHERQSFHAEDLGFNWPQSKVEVR